MVEMAVVLDAGLAGIGIDRHAADGIADNRFRLRRAAGTRSVRAVIVVMMVVVTGHFFIPSNAI